MYSAEIGRMNQWYLNSLRQAATKDLPGACVTFGVSREYAETVVDMSTEQIEAVSLSGRTLFQPAIAPQELRGIAEVGDGYRDVYGELAGA